MLPINKPLDGIIPRLKELVGSAGLRTRVLGCFLIIKIAFRPLKLHVVDTADGGYGIEGEINGNAAVEDEVEGVGCEGLDVEVGDGDVPGN